MNHEELQKVESLTKVIFPVIHLKKKEERKPSKKGLIFTESVWDHRREETQGRKV